MSSSLTNIKLTIRDQKSKLKNDFDMRSIGIFGSYARGDNKETSDIDLLVEFSAPIGMFKFIEMEEFLSKALGKKVDLVTKKALKPIIKDEILKETVYV